ncbi:hypothetical protein CFOL_v3_07939 [Cephalotus follicularis]|uniref:RING-type domain-containing protein n=1 Tax=Cephalotus follicularis TaxID=3775 RepID=A0A1Q3B8Q6_CEPFO|nr:hypothetical protein CFOL_v3_07939 [Cephalotus follicularis]
MSCNNGSIPVLKLLDSEDFFVRERHIQINDPDLPGRNDSSCAICLSEYCDKETLSCVPECGHCFHAISPKCLIYNHSLYYQD